MTRWTLLSGSPRFGELPAATPGRPKASVDARLRNATLAAAASGLVTLYAAAGMADALLTGPDALLAHLAAPVVGGLALVAAALAVAHAVADPEGPGLLHGAAAAATLVLAALLPLAPVHAVLLPALLEAQAVGAGAALALTALVALGAPVAGAAHVRAQALLVNLGGAAGRHAPLPRLLAARDAEDVITPSPGVAVRALAALPGVLLEGVAHPVLLAADAAVSALRRARTRAGGLVVDRVHADVDPLELDELFARHELAVEPAGRGLRVAAPPIGEALVQVHEEDLPLLPRLGRAAGRLFAGAGRLGHGDGARVQVRPRRLRFPRLARDRVLDLRGDPRAVRALRRLLEGDLAFDLAFAWSAEAVRLERRVNGLHRDARAAETVEERTRLLDDAERLARRLDARDLLESERVLVAGKLARVRLMLQDALLQQGGTVKTRERAVAPFPVVEASLRDVVQAGGTGAGTDLRYVPHWIVPVTTAWGQLEIVVNAVTGRLDAWDSREIHAALRARGPRTLLDGTRRPHFLEAPDPATKLYAEVRRHLRHDLGYWGPVGLDDALVETVLVPCVAQEDGTLVNALTGARWGEADEAPPAEPADEPPKKGGKRPPQADPLDELRQALVE